MHEMGVVAFIISCVRMRVSFCHDSTSFLASSRLTSKPVSLSADCRSRSPASSPSVGRRKEKSWLCSASRISWARSESSRWWRHCQIIMMTMTAARAAMI